MNQDELKTWLQENLNSDVERDFFRDNFSCDEEYYEEDSEEEKSIFFFSAKDKGITWVSEDSYGGEGQGDDFWNVVRFSAGATLNCPACGIACPRIDSRQKYCSRACVRTNRLARRREAWANGNPNP